MRSLAGEWTEVTVPVRDIVRGDVYPTFGLTDAAIESICQKKGPVVVTDDVRLFAMLASTQRPVINFSFLRDTQ